MNSFNLDFNCLVFYFFSSEAITLQYKWSCKHEKEPLFRKFYLGGGGGGRGNSFTKRDFFEVQIVISPLIFKKLKKRVFNFQLLSLPSVESVKTMLEFLYLYHLTFSVKFMVKKFGPLSSIYLPSLIRVCHVY